MNEGIERKRDDGEREQTGGKEREQTGGKEREQIGGKELLVFPVPPLCSQDMCFL